VPRLVAVGSIAYDSLATPFGRRERALGGSAVHFSLAARLFTEVGVVGVVGDDFDGEAVLLERGIDTSGIQVVEGGTTFAWEGRYGYDLNVAETLDTRLGVFEHFDPQLGSEHRDAPVLFLGNIQPDLQRSVRAQSNAAFVALDSMNLWIEIAKDSLVAAIGEVDVVILNDGEARQLTGEATLLKAARAISALGPRIVVIKRGEYGAALFVDGRFFGVPGYPLEEVFDPTGAGDSFAGGFVGYLAASGQTSPDLEHLRRAVAYGSIVASFNVEEFGTERVQRLGRGEVDGRVRDFHAMTSFVLA
jgi:sugar/nucleoside kinase (ribokinase family)